MTELYDVDGILGKRFEDLTYGGYFKLDGDVYVVTEKGRVILKIYKIAIDGLHLGTSELKKE